jgi:hypothetical protein
VVSNDTGLLGDIQSVVGIVGTVVTAAALVVGGLWAYFKFVKGRTYRPRLEVGMSSQWRQLDGMDLLHARITVQNIGNSAVTLLQRGTGLRVSVPAADQGTAPVAVAWTVLRVFEILGEHEWIEPGETVSDDVLLNLGRPEPVPVRFESRLVWRWSGRDSDDIVVFSRQVLPVSCILEGSAEAQMDVAPSTTEGQHELGAEPVQSSGTAAAAARAAAALRAAATAATAATNARD